MASRQELVEHLEAYYRRCGWPVERAEDGSVRAMGAGGVTWIGLPVTADDLADPRLPARLAALSDERMESGERCPLELLPATDCALAVRALLAELGLADMVSIYSLAVAA